MKTRLLRTAAFAYLLQFLRRCCLCTSTAACDGRGCPPKALAANPPPRAPGAGVAGQPFGRRGVIATLGAASSLDLRPSRAETLGGPSKIPCDDACWTDIFGNFKAQVNASVDSDDTRSQDNVDTLYGTITPKGIRTLTDRLQIDSSDVFTDLGSGIGNVVLQFYSNTPVSMARGIEFVKSRHLDAVRYVDRFKSKYGLDPKKQIVLVNGDMFKEDYSDSTIIFANDVGFYPSMMASLQRQCESIPRLKYLITFRALENTTLRLLGEVNKVEMDFFKKGLTFKVYTNRADVNLRSPPLAGP